MIDLDELKKLAEAVPELPWEVTGHTVYALEHDGWRKGVEQMRNRFSFSVQRGPETPESELQAIAEFCSAANPAAVLELIDMALAAAPQVVADELTDAQLDELQRQSYSRNQSMKADTYAFGRACYRAALQAAPVQAQEPVALLTLGGIDGGEYGDNDLELVSSKAVEKLQEQLVRGQNSVVLPLFAAPVQPVAVPDGDGDVESRPWCVKKGTFVGPNGWPDGWIISGVGASADSVLLKLEKDGTVFSEGRLHKGMSIERMKVMIACLAAPAAQGDALSTLLDNMLSIEVGPFDVAIVAMATDAERDEDKRGEILATEPWHRNGPSLKKATVKAIERAIAAKAAS